MKNPKVSVLLPVYNGEKYLQESIKSILNQTFEDFELIIIDDGSVDKTPEIVKKNKDSRIRILTNEKNLGVSRSLNHGLRKVKGKYIARCDGDDLNNRSRFKIQVNFLDQNPEVVMVGSNAELINEKGKIVGRTNYPLSDIDLRKKMLIRNSVLHPSVMFRKSAINKIGGYSNIFNGVEDYRLFFQLMTLGKIQNMEDYLIKRRFHKDAVTKINHNKIEMLAILVRLLGLLKI
jgi:glycosyltransferase involved in cell wall biosynthesis